jgi:hypothetical protein
VSGCLGKAHCSAPDSDKGVTPLNRYRCAGTHLATAICSVHQRAVDGPGAQRLHLLAPSAGSRQLRTTVLRAGVKRSINACRGIATTGSAART